MKTKKTDGKEKVLTMTEPKLLQQECGVTRISIDNAKSLITNNGKPTYVQLSYNDGDWYQVRAVWSAYSFHDFTGFTWGYRGEGPSGLAEFFKMIDAPYNIDHIASWSQYKWFEIKL